VDGANDGANDAAHDHVLGAACRDAAAVVADLRAELAAIAESTESSPDDEHDAEGSTVGYERARVSSLLAGAQEHLRSLERAIARDCDGERARCERCGQPIDAERLEALPGTFRCAPCARSAAADDRLGTRRPWPSRRTSRSPTLGQPSSQRPAAPRSTTSCTPRQ